MLNLKYCTGTSLVVQGLRLPGSTAGGVGSIPGQGTEILHGTCCSQKKKKKDKNELTYEIETDSQTTDIENRLVVATGAEG